MKRRVLTFLLVLPLLFTFAFPALAVAANEIRLLGDADNDGEVSYNDALLALRASVALADLDPESREAADVDNSGVVDYNDALLLLRYSVQLIDTFPAALCTVTFSANGEGIENLPASIEVKRGECVEIPETPVREGYTFEGWFRDPGCEQAFDFTTPMTDNLTLYALWVEYIEPVPEETVPEETVPEETVPEEPVPKVVDLTEKLDALMHESA